MAFLERRLLSKSSKKNDGMIEQDGISKKKQSQIEEKNPYKYYSFELNSQSYREFLMKNDLYYAIEKDEMRVLYQPIVNLKSGEILAVEALVRWMHPDWGLVLPNEFIHLADETGLIIDIGKWVLREVCKNYKRWLDKGLPPIKVAVNFSGIQFMESDFADKIKTIIDEYELDPKFLIIEITENILLKNTYKLNSHIESLRSLGIQIALNNFGKGFSSFAYLNSFKVDIIKLDGSFIKDVPFDSTNSAIVESVIHLTKKLNIKMVAEGIENWDQLSYLKYLNCHAGQGYIYSEAVDPEKIERMLARKKCKPIIVNNTGESLTENRRKFFRIKLPLSLEAILEVLEVKGNQVNIGKTKVLIKDIGPGGLCFISNIKFPVRNEIILQFTFKLLEEEIKVRGYIIRIREAKNNLYEYGVEFTIDENERVNLIRILNQVQIKIRKNIMFSEGSFISVSDYAYFK